MSLPTPTLILPEPAVAPAPEVIYDPQPEFPWLKRACARCGTPLKPAYRELMREAGQDPSLCLGCWTPPAGEVIDLRPRLLERGAGDVG